MVHKKASREFYRVNHHCDGPRDLLPMKIILKGECDRIAVFRSNGGALKLNYTPSRGKKVIHRLDSLDDSDMVEIVAAATKRSRRDDSKHLNRLRSRGLRRNITVQRQWRRTQAAKKQLVG